MRVVVQEFTTLDVWAMGFDDIHDPQNEGGPIVEQWRAAARRYSGALVNRYRRVC